MGHVFHKILGYELVHVHSMQLTGSLIGSLYGDMTDGFTDFQVQKLLPARVGSILWIWILHHTNRVIKQKHFQFQFSLIYHVNRLSSLYQVVYKTCK